MGPAVPEPDTGRVSERANTKSDAVFRAGARGLDLPLHARMRTLWYDARYGLRGLLKKPGFSAIILATVALGVGANTALFTVVNAVLIRPMGFRQPDRVVALEHLPPYTSVSEPEFEDYRRDAHAFRQLAAYAFSDVTLTGADEPERVSVVRASEDFFNALGVAPARGRTFTTEEGRHGGPPVAMVSHGLWTRKFGADPHLVGKTLTLNGTVATIVGVMPRGFDYPEPDVDVWVPLRLNPDSLWTRNNHYLRVIGRLAPDATIGEAKAEVATLARRFTHDFPDIYAHDKLLATSVRTVRDTVVGDTRPYLFALLGAVGFVLLIACANVANLLLVRGEARRKELAVRTALGASPRRLARQLLTESTMLALGGGALGLALGWAGVRVFVAAAPSSIPRLDGVRIDLAVLAFTLAITVLTGVLFGMLPALRGTGGQPAAMLGVGGRSSSPRAQRAIGRVLVAAEVALAVVTLAGAGLLVRSLLRLRATDLGFDAEHVLTMQVTVSRTNYADDPAVVRFYTDLLGHISGMHGVRGAAAIGDLPISGDNSAWSIMIDGRVLRNISEAPSGKPEQVTPDYFRVMSIPMVKGRAFTERDRPGASPVVVVNETMARQLWPAREALGQTLKMFRDPAPWLTVVGVAGDVRSSGGDQEVPPTMYFPYAQAGTSASYTPKEMTLVVKTTSDPLALTDDVRRTVRNLDPVAPISSVQSMDAVVGRSLANRRFTTTLLAAFALLALVLAGVGIYGVISFGVSERTFEMGLRQALGAERRTLLLLIVKEGVRMTVVGLAIGLVGAVMAGRLIRSLLVGTSPSDGATFVVVSTTLIVVAILASVLPARRAMGVHPTEALRSG